MAAFKFNLEFLLTLRRRLEEQAAGTLAKRLKVIRELEARVVDMERVKETLQDDLKAHIEKGSATPPLLNMYSEFQAKLFQDKMNAEKLLEKSRLEEVKERAALRKRVMERQLMERFKEKKADEWKDGELKLEQNVIEEMAALVKARKIRMEKDGT
ncbi:MAG: hypothetical protein LBR53_10905 [Deltaproteobacteria bacterium]|jgi:flagellar export protein FliJ|nr:hypothetical protein [Deltaproteobacteria bacterium]